MTTLFVSTVGGHLAQLHDLVDRLQGVDTTDRLWVTHEDEQSASLLEGEAVEWVPYIEERDVAGVARALGPAARLVGSRSIDAVVSTGSAIAVAYLGAARVRRRRAYFIESTAFVRSHSRTGRIVQRMPGVATFTQSAQLADGSWRHRGSVLDGYHAQSVEDPRSVQRLVVSVGTSRSFGYRRLLERLVEIIPGEVEVLWQTGCTEVADLPIDASPWVPFDELAAATAAADAYIAHAGGGSTLTALASGRRPLLVPRVAAAGDFADDHQLEIADLLAERGLAVVRSVDAITWDDIVDASRWTVHRVDEPAPFDLSAAA